VKGLGGLIYAKKQGFYQLFLDIPYKELIMGKLLNIVLLALFVWGLIFLYHQNDAIPGHIQNAFQKAQDFICNFTNKK